MVIDRVAAGIAAVAHIDAAVLDHIIIVVVVSAIALNIPELWTGGQALSILVPQRGVRWSSAASPISGRGMWKNARDGTGVPPLASV